MSLPTQTVLCFYRFGWGPRGKAVLFNLQDIWHHLAHPSSQLAGSHTTPQPPIETHRSLGTGEKVQKGNHIVHPTSLTGRTPQQAALKVIGAPLIAATSLPFIKWRSPMTGGGSPDHPICGMRATRVSMEQTWRHKFVLSTLSQPQNACPASVCCP